MNFLIRLKLICIAWMGFMLPTTSAVAASNLNSPVGIWLAFDDTTGQPEAEIKLSLVDGVLVGTVLKDLETPVGQPPLTCTLCSDDRKNKPVVGLEVVRHARYNPSYSIWEKGEILDPSNGQTYQLKLKVLEDGKKLQVKGYFGLFYRTQFWQRIN